MSRRPVTLFTGQWADLPFTEVCELASRALGLPRSPDHEPQLVEIEWLGDIVEGALLHRGHRRLDARVCSHHDHDGFRPLPLDGRERREPVHPGELEVDECDVWGELAERG